MHPSSVALAALTVALGAAADQPLQLLPAGEFRGNDGRPDNAPAWRLDRAVAERVIAAARARGTRIAIDYEHQTLYAEKNGQPAPAAGWIDPAELEWREGAGLFARRVEWTARAARMIAEGEYRYFSPVFAYAKGRGDVLALRLGALTNNPGLDGMLAVALSSLSIQQETPVNETLNKLLAQLGLPADTSEEDALAGVAALKSKADQVAGLQTEVAALKAQAPDPAKYVSVATMTELQGQVAALSAQIAQGEAGQVIDQAVRDGKLLPAQRTWAESLGKTDLAALKSYVATAPKIAPADGQRQTRGDPDKGATGGAGLTEAELAVCTSMGLDPAEFAKHKEA